jgi:hypothetical protein
VAGGNPLAAGGSLLFALSAHGSSARVGVEDGLRGGRHRAAAAHTLAAGSSHVDVDVEKRASSAPYLARQNVGDVVRTQGA